MYLKALLYIAVVDCSAYCLQVELFPNHRIALSVTGKVKVALSFQINKFHQQIF